jgi:hypothetical protein
MSLNRIRMTPISGNGQKPSFFGSNLQQSRIFYAPGSHNRLGILEDIVSQTTASAASASALYEWVTRAEAAINRIDSLSARVPAIGNTAERTKVIEWFGDPASSGTPAHARALVKADLEEAENYSPPNYNIFNETRRQNHIQTLEGLAGPYETLITSAAGTFGSSPPPIVPAHASVTQETKPEIIGPGEYWGPTPQPQPQPQPAPSSSKDQEILKTFMEEMRKTGKELLSQPPKSEFPVVPVLVGVGVLAAAGLIVALIRKG